MSKRITEEATERRRGLFNLGEHFNTTLSAEPPRQDFEEDAANYQVFPEAEGEPWLYEDDPFDSPEGRGAGKHILFPITEGKLDDAINALRSCVEPDELKHGDICA